MKYFRFIKLSVMLMLFAILTGCAVGQAIRYDNTSLELQASGNYVISVSTHDARPYVVNGEKYETYIGTLRGGFGNPFDVITQSGKSLAQDMSDVITNSLKKKGYNATSILVDPKSSQDQIINKLKGTNATRFLIVTLSEWYSNTYIDTLLYYDIKVLVLNNDGNVLAQTNTKGEDNLGGSAWNPPAHAKAAVPEAYKKKLESLLNTPSIINALK